LKWRTTLPVVSNPGMALPPQGLGQRARFSPSPDLRVKMGAAPDGQRVVAMVYPCPDRDMTWVYVLDGHGEIVQSVAVKDRDPAGANVPGGGQILKAGGQGAFILSFRHAVPVDSEKPQGGSHTVHESCLVDRDGNFIRKFVDEQGRPVKNGGREHLIYRLP
jgi:hypothetical protein